MKLRQVLGFPVGLGLGVAVGIMIDNVGLGLGFGVVAGAVLEANRKK